MDDKERQTFLELQSKMVDHTSKLKTVGRLSQGVLLIDFSSLLLAAAKIDMSFLHFM